jgi:hypothetical protein
MDDQQLGNPMRHILRAPWRCAAWLLPLILFVWSQAADAGSGYKNVYHFPGGALGAYPYGGLLADANGNLYGTTYAGG